MAEKNSTGLERFMAFEGAEERRESMVADGVKRCVCTWGCYFTGRREALIAAGIACADWFQDGTEKDRRGRPLRRKLLQVEGREIRTVTEGKHRATVHVNYTDEEKETAEKIHEEIMKKEDAERAKQNLIELSAEQGAQKLAGEYLSQGLAIMQFAFNCSGSANVPWRSSLEVTERARELCAELHELMEENPVRPTKIVKARTDKGFQEFIGKLKG